MTSSGRHTVYLEQTYLPDSDEATFQLKKTYGLTYQPSMNGYPFYNSDMAEAASSEVTKDRFLGGLTGGAYGHFKDSYGAGEVSALGGTTNPLVWANYFIWYHWWKNDDIATCLALSTLSLSEYFADVSNQLETEEAEILNSVIQTQSHLLGDELLGMLMGNTILDGVPIVGSYTEKTVESIVDFFSSGSDGGSAPVMIMIPDLSTYSAVMADYLDVITGIVTYGLFDSITELAKDLADSVDDMVEAIGDAHVLAPYMVVYEDPSDDLPSRIFFYDCNDPQNNNVSMEIYEENGEVKFDYEADIYSTDKGWILSSATIDFVMSDPDLLIDEDLTHPLVTVPSPPSPPSTGGDDASGDSTPPPEDGSEEEQRVSQPAAPDLTPGAYFTGPQSAATPRYERGWSCR